MREALKLSYKFDFETLEMIIDILNKVQTGEHKGDDVQKDLVLAQSGLNMLVEEMIKNKIESITKESK